MQPMRIDKMSSDNLNGEIMGNSDNFLIKIIKHILLLRWLKQDGKEYLKVKVNKPIKKGELVSLDDIESVEDD